MIFKKDRMPPKLDKRLRGVTSLATLHSIISKVSLRRKAVRSSSSYFALKRLVPCFDSNMFPDKALRHNCHSSSFESESSITLLHKFPWPGIGPHPESRLSHWSLSVIWKGTKSSSQLQEGGFVSAGDQTTGDVTVFKLCTFLHSH